MAEIKSEQMVVYYAPTKRRRYLSARNAAGAEATAMIAAKYPYEKYEYDEFGNIIYQKFHWTQDPFLVRVHARLTRIILAKFKKEGTHE